MSAFLLAASLLLAHPSPSASVPTGEVTALEGPEHLSPFFARLQELDPQTTRPVRVAWWGDSALVGDGYTSAVRRALQERFGDGGPGFLLFSPPFGGYRHATVRMKRHHWETKSVLHGGLKSGRFGLAGVTAGSYGGAGSTYIFDKPVDRMHVFYRGGPRAGGLQVYLNEEKVTSQILDAKGETWADQVWSPDFGREITWARLRAAGGGRTEVYGVAFERAGPGVVVDTLGIVGIRARRWRKADSGHIAAQLRSRGVDLVVLNFGGNERVDRDLSVDKHALEIRETLDRFRAEVPGTACMLVGPLAHGHKGSHRLDPRLETIAAAQRRVAQEAGCAYMDTIALMGGDSAVSQFRTHGWMGKDLSHLNGKGHQELGARMGRWLLSRYDLWRKARAAEAQLVGPPL